MLTVQEVGKQILTGNPGKFYVFSGEEYGIKEKYIDTIKLHYDGNYIESSDVSSVLSLMNRKQIIPLTPKLYIVRYDESFISSLSDRSEPELLSSKILGTIVCIYEESKHCNKVEKYLPNLTVRLDKVNPQFVFKYLKDEFSCVPDRLIQLSIDSTQNYSQARNMCRSMSKDVSCVNSLTDDDISFLFGTVKMSSDAQIRIGVASRNFEYIMNAVDSYSGQYDSALYTILSTMLELEKLLVNKYLQSDIKCYVNRWNLKDIYYFFNHTYYELKKLRSISSNAKLSLIYLASMLSFQQILTKEDIS